MYAKLVPAVKTPVSNEKGKVITLSNGYVYWATEFWWDAEKQKTKDNRVGIGKLLDDDHSLMYPNKKYETFFGPIDPAATEFRNHLRGTTHGVPGQFHYSLTYGLYAVIRKAAEKSGMLDALGRAFPKLWRKVFAICLHAVSAENSVAQSFPGWAFYNYCGLDRNINGSQVSKLYKEIGKDNESIMVFFKLYHGNFAAAFPEGDGKKERVVAFDSTNQVTESHNQPAAKRGKSKTGEPLPIIQTAMYVDEKTGIPIWYEHFDGNVLDKTQTPYSIEKANGLGYQKLFLMMDSGYYSEETAMSLQELGTGFAMMMPDTPGFVGKLISGFKEKLRLKEEYYINQENIYGAATTQEVGGYTFHAYVYYDDETAADERKTIHGSYDFFYAEASRRKRYTDCMKKKYAPRGIIVEKTAKDPSTGKNFTLRRDNEMLQQAQDDAGFFVILSNRRMTAEEVILIARGRDHAEKAFSHMKSHFDLPRTYMHSDVTYRGKMFVAFCALIMLQSFCWYEKGLLQAVSSETSKTLISEINRYAIQQKEDKSWMPCYAMNKKQKDIVTNVGLTEEQIEAEIRALKFRL